jgi:PAS domain S-box-containing protein
MSGILAADTSAGNITLPASDIIMDTFDFDLASSNLDLDDLALDSIIGPPQVGPLQQSVSEDSLAPDGQNAVESQPSSQSLGVNTVTDFTRRRNWAQRIVDEMKDMLLVLSADGRIRYVSPSCRTVAEYQPEQLNGKFLSHFIHKNDQATFIREFNESIATGHRVRFHYRFKKKNDDSFVILEASGHPHMVNEKVTLGTGKEGNPCNGFFLISRPYPTKSCQLLDSFLEHKIESIRLTKRIDDLKFEEEEEEQRLYQQLYQQLDDNDNITTDTEIPNPESTVSPSERGAMLQPGTSGTSGSSHDIHVSGVSDSGINSATQIDNSSYIDGIEIMTGLRYGEGERSRGLSTGETNGSLIQDDADVALLADQLGRSPVDGDKKKKLKTSEEYVCTDCGTLASPEWRKGPSGPKTLCNACGRKFFYFYFYIYLSRQLYIPEIYIFSFLQFYSTILRQTNHQLISSTVRWAKKVKKRQV